MEETVDLREYFGIVKKKILDSCTYNNNSSCCKWSNKLFYVKSSV